MTRSCGDCASKVIGVVAEPELKIIKKLTKNDKILVLASDGLWDYFSNEEIMQIITTKFYEKRESDAAVNYLIQEASRRWTNDSGMVDDITIIIAFLDCGTSAQSSMCV